MASEITILYAEHESFQHFLLLSDGILLSKNLKYVTIIKLS